MKWLLLFIFLFLSLIFSCRQDNGRMQRREPDLEASRTDFSFHTILRYADGFDVKNYSTHKEIYVFNPGGKDTLATYITAPYGTKLPDSIKGRGVFISVPVNTIACLSTTNVGGISILGLQEKLVGVSSPEYIWDEEIQKRVREGKVKEIARGMGFNIERIVELAPDLLMQNYMDRTDVDGKLSKLGINVLYNNAWKESTLLGRAEWLKFIALFFGKEQLADSIFNEVETSYEEIKAVARTAKSKPSVVYGSDYKGVWYLPQNQTYVAQTIRDANAIFKGAGEGNSSEPKSFEEIYDMFYDAKYWLCTHSRIQNMKEFLSSNERYIEFDAAKNNRVYLNNKREKPMGGNDYWESGINRPDLLLKDIVAILHPELYPEYEMTYWQHLD